MCNSKFGFLYRNVFIGIETKYYDSAVNAFFFDDDNMHQKESENTIHKSYYVIINDIPAIYSVSESNLPWLNMSFDT